MFWLRKHVNLSEKCSGLNPFITHKQAKNKMKNLVSYEYAEKLNQSFLTTCITFLWLK